MGNFHIRKSTFRHNIGFYQRSTGMNTDVDQNIFLNVLSCMVHDVRQKILKGHSEYFGVVNF